MVKLLAASMFTAWLILVLFGKRGGFMHLLLLVGTTIAVIELVYHLRARINDRDPRI